MNKAGIYVHIPFCEQKCPYCDFYSLSPTEKLQEAYVNAVIVAMNIYANKNIIADTLYFGGGTPTLLKSDLLDKIINHSKTIFGEFEEITVEANPNSTTDEWICKAKNFGVNRISFGMQSTVEKELHTLGRKHTFTDVENAVRIAKRYGINNISIDVMLGIPHQNLSSIKDTLDKISTLSITHISAYMLKIEPKTAFNTEQIISSLPNEDDVSDIYLYVCERLSEMGFYQYEISNFAKKGYESRHNLKYWLGNNYLGFGASAHSFYDGKRFYYPNDINAFISGGHLAPKLDEVSQMSKLEEYIVFHSRLSEGVDLAYLENNFNVNTKNLISKLNLYIKNDFIRTEKGKIFFTPKGFLVSNELILLLLKNCE